MEFGGFDEQTGEFIKYSANILDLAKGWNSVALLIQNFGMKE